MRIHPTVKAWLPPTALLLLALIVVGPPLLPWRHLVLAPPQSDIIQQHIGWQEFSAAQLRQGIIPLWNPHAGAGQPFVAAWQGAVFYPPTWLCLLMDAGLAINWLLALHLAWAAIGVYALCRGRRLGYVASTTAGAMFMLCGPMFLRAYAGQYIPLATIAWAPWLFLCLDHVLEGATTAWLLAAIAIVALQFCAGYPQFAYVTALLAGVYVVVNATDVRSFRPLAALAIVYLAAVLLSAAQVFTSFGGALESTRSTGLGVEWAGSYSMPVESLITLIAPGFMGDPHQVFTGGPGIPYFGRFFLWEANAFIGAIAVFLAVYAAISIPQRRLRFAPIIILVSGYLALGANLPNFALLYKYLPGLSFFRAPNRFFLIGAMFFCVLAAHGLDRILTGQARYKPVAMAAALAGCAMILAGIWVTHSAAGGPDNSFWGELLHRTSTPVDSTLPWNLHRDANFLNQSAAYAGHQLIAAAVPLLIAAALIAMLGASSRLRWCGPLIGLLVVGQSLSYAWGFRDATPWHGYEVPVQWADVLPRIGDRRVVISNELGNLAQFLGLDSVWDYEVFTLARYQRLLNEGHTGDPVLLTGANEPKDPRLLQLLRCAWVLPASGQPREIADPLPHVLILDRCQVETDPASAIQAVRSPGFDPHSLVVLEKPPEPAPRIGASGGWAMIVRSNINEMEIVAELPQPGILLVTDSFGQGWHVRAVEESASQHDYQVMPADFALRAVPLAAGRHHFVIFYMPIGFQIGRWASLAGLAVYGLLWWWVARKMRRPADAAADR